MAFLRAHGTSPMAVFLLLTGLIIGVEVFVTHTAAFNRYPVHLSAAVLFDLVFIPTGLFYWLIGRPLRLPISRSALVGLLMLRIALWIIPQTAFPAKQIWPTLLILTESTVVITVVFRIRTVIQTYRRLRNEADAETALRESLSVVVSKRVVGLIIGEGLILYYALLGWRLKSDLPIEAYPLTTHRQSGQVALTIGLLTVGLIEGVAVHLLLVRLNPTIAFWITTLTAYGMLFFLADLMATLRRPSYLTSSYLTIRLGVRWRARILRSSIEHVALISEKPAKQAGYLNGAILTVPNVLLTFQEPIVVEGPYGLQKTIRQLSLFVDDRADFVDTLNS
ncbi:hypothetical protein [Spirosoma sp. KNUC1025]|uniref:hypothetical protein n=1 Tax=Spirosoma sp. KNUC1025 TaxID=2894082 RepID=UPI00386CC1DB|nr:hypothetical protein LN737_04280 [Spirosoma sp. KNUC1025]